MPHVRIATVFNIELEFEAADLPRRLLAYLVDFTLLILYFMLAKYILYQGNMANMNIVESRIGIDILLISTPMLLYSLVCEAGFHGQSIGKRLLDIRVISLDGKEPVVSQYLIRWMFRAFEWPFFFGYVFFSGTNLLAFIIVTGLLGIGVITAIAVTPKNQRLGDLAANTVVVRTSTNLTVDDTLFVDIEPENYVARFPEVLKLSDRDMNTIIKILKNYHRSRKQEMCERLADKIKTVLHIQTDLEAVPFLQTLLKDYNYLSNK